MAYLTRPAHYNIEESNIALLGSDLEKRVREHAGDKELAWDGAGKASGVQIWRIEQFRVVEWPSEYLGTFYDGDSYIVLNTYKKSPNADTYSYDLHFWLGQNTTQDEAGTAAYKTVELDDHLHGRPVQYREVQNFESSRFMSYFPRFICLHGGTATGFHHITNLPPPEVRKLYHVKLSRLSNGSSNLVVREVPPVASSLIEGDVYVLDKGAKILQLNTKNSAGQERYKAAEFVRSLADERKGQSDVVVYDEGSSGATSFLREFGEGTILLPVSRIAQPKTETSIYLFRISDENGAVTFSPVAPAIRGSLVSDDAFLLDNSRDSIQPTIYVWIGANASLTERRLSLQYAQDYLYSKKAQQGSFLASILIVKLEEGQETEEFIQAFSI